MIRTIAIVAALAFVTPAFAQGAAQPAAGGMAGSNMAASAKDKDSKMAAKPMAKAKAKTTDAMAKDAKPAAAK
jgi:hypothetical protein